MVDNDIASEYNTINKMLSVNYNLEEEARRKCPMNKRLSNTM